MDYIALGRRIKEERLKLNMTQERLAEEVNLSTSYIGQIERGERKLTLDSLINITNCLGVTVDYLLQESIIQDQVSYKDRPFVRGHPQRAGTGGQSDEDSIKL